VIEPMSDEEAEEFEQRRPWLAKAAALIGSGLATIVGLVEVFLIGFLFLIVGAGAQGNSLPAVLIITASATVASFYIVGIEEHSDAAHPRVSRVLTVGYLLWTYLLGLGIALAGSGSPFAEPFLYGVTCGLALNLILDSFVFGADAMFHDRLFGEVSSS